MLDTTKREGLSWAVADFRLNTWMGTVTGHSTSYSISCLGGEHDCGAARLMYAR